MSGPVLEQTADQVRRAFDESFAKVVTTEREAAEELLAIRAQESQLAVRTRETAGIMRCSPLTTVPSANGALSGLAGIRGSLVAVYSIAALVGDEHGPSRDGWIILCAADRSVALLFDELVSYERVHVSDIHLAGASETRALPAREVVRIGGINRAVIGIPWLLENIRRTARAGGTRRGE